MSSLPRFIPEFMVRYVRRRGSPMDRAADLWAQDAPLLEPMRGPGSPAGRSLRDAGESPLDLVVGIPPWGWHPQIATIDEADPPVVICDDPANAAIVRACMRLAPHGVGMFIVAPGFALRPGNRTALPVLARLGWRAEAVIGVPRGIFQPDSGSGRWLMAFSRRSVPPVSGQLTGDPESAERLLAAVAPTVRVPAPTCA